MRDKSSLRSTIRYTRTVPKIPSFRLTLLSFTGQIFTGIILDLITRKGFTMATFSGGLLVAAGVGISMGGERFALLFRNKSPVPDETL